MVPVRDQSRCRYGYFDLAIYDSEGEHFTASRLTFRNPADGIAFGSAGKLYVERMEIRQLYNKMGNWSFEDGSCTETAQSPGWVKPAQAEAQTVYSEVRDAATGSTARKIECKAEGCVQINTADMHVPEPGENYVIKMKIKG
jgi:hypothetical protein